MKDPASSAGLGPRPRLPQRTTNAEVDAIATEPGNEVRQETVDTVEGPDRPWRSTRAHGDRRARGHRRLDLRHDPALRAHGPGVHQTRALSTA